MKVVVDTNIVVSGLLHPERNAASLLRLWRAGHFTWVSAAEQIEELAIVLGRPYFLSRIGDSETVKRLLGEMHGNCSLQAVSCPLRGICRDPKDDWLLSIYGAASADLLISGDQDLLARNGQYRVMTVAEFLRRL